MGTICTPEKTSTNSSEDKALVNRPSRGAGGFEYEEDSDSEYSDSDDGMLDTGPQHTPQPSREDMEAERAMHGFIKAFESGNESLAIHLVDEYPELDMVNHIWDDGRDCLRIAVEHQNEHLVVFCLEEGLEVESATHSPTSAYMYSV